MLRLSDCLNYADINTLRAIADYYDFQCTKHSKLSLLQEISYNFRIPTFLREHLPGWVEGRDIGLLRLSLETNRPYTLEELKAWLSSEEGIERAVIEGWLFPTSRLPDSRKLYCIPEELRNRIAEYSLENFCNQLTVTEEAPLLYADEQNLLAQDLDVFLEYVRNHEVTITQDGALYKRHLTQVLDVMQISEEPLSGGWRFGYGRRFHDYPDRFALLYDFAFAEGFIEENDFGILKVTENSHRWLEANENQRTKWLLTYYASSYRRAIIRLPIILRLVSVMKQQWVTEESMFRAVNPFLQDYYYDSVDDVWNTRIMKMMQHLGLIRRGEDENGAKWFQTTNIGQQLLATGEMPEVVADTSKHKILLVQPNFNILATADQPAVTAQLAQIANLHETGAVRVYRLNQQTFCRGLAADNSCQQWIDFLQSHSQTPLPGNVEKTLYEWERAWLAEQDPLTS